MYCKSFLNLIECDGDDKCDGGKVCSLENPPYGKCVGRYFYIFMIVFFSGILCILYCANTNLNIFFLECASHDDCTMGKCKDNTCRKFRFLSLIAKSNDLLFLYTISIKVV